MSVETPAHTEVCLHALVLNYYHYALGTLSDSRDQEEVDAFL